MFGFNGNIGILQASAEYILERGHISVSVIEFQSENVYDLGNGKKVTMTKGYIPSHSVIQTGNEFKHLISNATKLRSHAETNQNKTSSRSHLMVTIKYVTGPSAGKILFADLAGAEAAHDPERIGETNFINSSLNGLNQIFMNLSRGLIINYSANNLTKFLREYLQPTSSTIMLYHLRNDAIQKGLELIKDYAALTTEKKRGQISGPGKMPNAVKKNALQNITNIRL